MSTANIQQVAVDYAAILPLLIVAGGAVVGILVEAFAPRRARHAVQVALTVVTLLGALAALILVARHHEVITLGGSVAIDGVSLFLQGALLIFGTIGVLAMSERFGGHAADAFTPMGASRPGSPQEAAASRAGYATSEVFPLALFSLFGMMSFVAANDLITMFVALEVLSLPLYVMTGLARRRRLLSQEASLKYFLLGAFSSAFFLFGSALLYGYAGSVALRDIAASLATSPGNLNGLLLVGILFVLIGLLFKVGAAPFHAWTPDAYQGAPTPVTGFMAAATKMAAFGAMLRFLYVAAAGDRWSWQYAVAGVAVLTMLVGALFSLTQVDIKRLLAYSSIAHAGFILVGVLAFDRAAVAGVMFYLLAYGFATIAAFALIALVRKGGAEATQLSQWAGLGRRHPVVAAIFSLLLLAFAGIPLTSGFTAKFAAFAPAVAYGGTMGVVLVIIGVLASAMTAYIYARVIVLMYFSDPEEDEDDEPVVALTPGIPTTIVVTIGALATLVLGIAPGWALDLAGRASTFLL